MSTPLELTPKKRTGIVWFISIYFFLTAGNNLLTMYLAQLEGGRMPAETKAYYAAMPGFEYGFAIALMILLLSGAVALFFLHRSSVWLFSAGLAGNLGLAVWHLSTRGLADVWHHGGFGMLFAWAIMGTVVYYANRVTKSPTQGEAVSGTGQADQASSPASS